MKVELKYSKCKLFKKILFLYISLKVTEGEKQEKETKAGIKSGKSSSHY